MNSRKKAQEAQKLSVRMIALFVQRVIEQRRSGDAQGLDLVLFVPFCGYSYFPF